MSVTPPHLAADPPAALPRGTRLGEFELRHVLGVGGFAIVYLAFDHQLEREVAVKEYMPTMLAGRTETLHVSLRSKGDAETFALGLKSFVNEARLLARFDLPALVRVHRFWEANGTAYMAMPVVRGQSAKAWRQAQTSPPDEAWLRALLEPMLDTLEKLHAEAVYHRDIAPDNIQIDEGGRAVLLDLGAARRVIGDATQTLTAILKPAYAPIEQYAEVGALRQGAWTDLYALGATLHYLLLGRPPLPATARALHDELPPLAGQALPGCSLRFLQVVDWMLSPRPQDRPRSVAMLRDALQGRIAPPERVFTEPAAAVQWERTQVLSTPPAEELADVTLVTGPPAALPAAKVPLRPEASAAQVASGAVPVAAPAAAPATSPSPASRPRSRLPLVAAVVGVLVVVGAAAAWMGGGPTTPSAAEQIAASDAGSVAAAASAVESQSIGAARPGSETSTGPAASTPGEELGKVAPALGSSTGSVTAVALGTAAGAMAADASGATPAAAAAPLSGAPAVVSASPAPRPATTPPVRRPPEQQRAPDSPPRVVATAPEPAPQIAQRVEPPAAPPPVLAPLVATPTPAVLLSPTERCGRRVLIALWNCIERQCREPELSNHPECVKLREDRERNVRGRL